MSSIATLAARVAAAKDHGERETAGNDLVRLIRMGGPDAAEAFDALCEALTNDIFHYYSVRVPDKYAARGMTLDLLEWLWAAYRDGKLQPGPDIESIYARILSEARSDVESYAEIQAEETAAETAAASDQYDQHVEVPSVGALAGSLELIDWLRQAAVELPHDLEITLLAYTQGLGPDELIAVTGIPSSDLHQTVKESKAKVIDRFLCLYIARTHGALRDVADENEICPELILSLSSLGGEERVWDQFTDFNTEVYREIRQHIPTCTICKPAYQENRKIALRRGFLAIPRLMFPTHSPQSDSIPDPENATADPPPGAVEEPSRAAENPRVAIELPQVPHVPAEHPQAPRPEGSSLPSGTPPPDPQPPSIKGAIPTKVFLGVACIAAIAMVVLVSIFMWDRMNEQEPGPQGTPPLPGAGVTSSAAPQSAGGGGRPGQAVGMSPWRTTGPAPNPTKPPAKPTSPPRTDMPTEAPSRPLEISLSISSTVCVPALTCEPVHSCSDCSLDYIGDCTIGVLVSARTTIKVNKGPATIRYRWIINGSPLASDSITFSGSGQQDTSLYKTSVVNRLSGSRTAQFEVLSPRSVKSDRVQSAVSCKLG